MTDRTRVRRVRMWLVLFVIGLVVSGVTAFPLVSESRLLVEVLHGIDAARWLPEPVAFLERVADGLADAGHRYPYLAYGTDWLAFAHLVIAVAFYGPLRDPVRNEWVVRFGMIACVAVVPLALIAGPLRGIPLYWRAVDCSFGVVGIVPLLLAYRHIRVLAGRTGTVPGTATA
ncbi:hypothetical protein [Actinocatenispora rupis]|uniref:hypothetical protein n=1 Tax=Actinocatenispora rupis TaxID=519421 RepID=UPI0019409E3C|nr:hypothetical protein [Actinocatenispora rupis]